jgi:tetratricopeptide (TPR) repeat protein
VVADALVELGRYEQAWPAVQRMVDLRPDTGSLARASYTWQLRGNTARAITLMAQARTLAPDAGQAAFAATHLAELAFDTGDLQTAARHVVDGLRQAPRYPPLLAVQAPPWHAPRARAALSRLAAA